MGGPDYQPYLERARRLIPLRGKVPRDSTNWRTREYLTENVRHAVKSGCNLGWTMGPCDVVLDVDPRKCSAAGVWALDALEKLRKDWPGIDEAPLVLTGGEDRGLHFYLQLPEGQSVHNPLEYAPLDFRHHGQYVVIAGSVHPDTGREYAWDLLTDPSAPGMEMPPWLCSMIKASPHPAPTTQGSRGGSGVRPFSEVEGLLSQVDPTTKSDYSEWLEIGMAVHAGTGGSGEGLALWSAWSTSDPAYSDAGDVCAQKWDSFEATAGGITVASLAQAAKGAGGTAAVRTSAAEDFDGVPIPTIPDAPTVKPRTDLVTDWIHERVDPAPPTVDLDALVGEAHRRFSLGDWERIRVAIKRSIGVSLKGLDKIYARIEQLAKARAKRDKSGDDELTDYGIEVAEKALEMFWEKGAYLLHAQNQIFYGFCGTHWAEVPPNVIDRRLLEAGEVLKAEGLEFRPSSALSTAGRVLSARCTQLTDVLGLANPTPPAVVNTRSAEVWIGANGGPPAVKKHNPKSYLMSVLDTEYDAAATCPIMDQTLTNIFRDNADPAAVVRHWWEFAGYTIQPRKNIPAWWMFYGDGSNGKSLVTAVLGALLGNAVLPRAVADFADTGRNNHAVASLVGKLLVLDDDSETTTLLPESALKKLSEAKLMEANPKIKNAYNFTSCATPVICINGWPKVRDLSWGMLRKTFIIPFRRKFKEDESDLNLKYQILENELPGVLNRALEGYARLRVRGRFDVPQECEEAKRDWLRLANPTVDYVHARTDSGEEFVTRTSEVFEDYRLWCKDFGGVKYSLSLGRFEVALMQMGYRAHKVANGVSVLKGIRLKESAVEY